MMPSSQLVLRLQLLFGKVLRYSYRKLPVSAQVKQKLVIKIMRFKWFRSHCIHFKQLQHQLLPLHEDSVYQQYIKGMFEERKDIANKPEYTTKSSTSLDADKLTLRAIAFYLPQFHPISENNHFWGAGFTEWTNVTKAVPQFLGHYQPHLPGELGFYDLRLPEVMHQQVALAKQYGIYGFCFYHYWFGGKRLLERPVKQFLADSTLDIKFCLCWANENWTRRWDGHENDVLVAQQHSAEDDVSFIEDLVATFSDTRYIRVDNKPLLLIYRASLFPNPEKTIQRWRTRIKELGFEDLYLVSVLTFDAVAKKQISFGFDAVVEFPPHNLSPDSIVAQHKIINSNYSGNIFSYQKVVNSYNPYSSDNIITLKGIMPSWDNEARRPGSGSTFFGATPELYAVWLKKVCNATLLHPPQKRFFFINAWNEWAEGAHLEPDRKFGYGYLQATANVLANYRHDPAVAEFIQNTNQRFRKKHNVAVILHCYYEELIDSIFMNYLVDKNSSFDLFVTVNPPITRNGLQKMRKFFPNIYIAMYPNHGRDIYPFLRILKNIKQLSYEFICKVHTKKSLHRQDGDQLRQAMFRSLLGGANKIQQVVQMFNADPKLGLLASQGMILDLSYPPYHLGNSVWLDKLLVRMGLPSLIGNYATKFPAGSMFWFRMQALKELDSFVLQEAQFEEEYGQVDGTLAHSVERIVALFAEQRGFHMQAIDSFVNEKKVSCTHG